MVAAWMTGWSDWSALQPAAKQAPARLGYFRGDEFGCDMEAVKMDFEYAGAESVGNAHVIGRSWLGGLSICFDGGCSYPSMISVLEAVFRRYGRLVRFGESLSAQDWIARVEESGFHISEQERVAVLTLMRGGG